MGLCGEFRLEFLLHGHIQFEMYSAHDVFEARHSPLSLVKWLVLNLIGRVDCGLVRGAEHYVFSAFHTIRE
jgi:hypothetical protein